MQFKNVKQLITPLIRSGQEWQSLSINGKGAKPRYYFSGVQWFILVFSSLVLLKLPAGISKEVIGYIMGAFSITVSLFMSLLVSIFDKFENTNFDTTDKDQKQIARLVQKKNFFKRFISITSYLVVLSILVIVLCSLGFIFDFFTKYVGLSSIASTWSEVDLKLTLKNIIVTGHRIALNYFLLNYLFLTFFITGSAFEYYMSEMNAVIIRRG